MTQTLTRPASVSAEHVPADVRACALIDLNALAHNISEIRAVLPSHVRIISVVKGNAYGHGLSRVVPALLSSGVEHFAVATLSEARELRALSTSATLFLLSPLFDFEISEALRLNIIPVISSFEEFQMLSAAAESAGIRWSVQLKVDTGMARAGIWHTQALQLAQTISSSPHLSLLGIFTHLAAGADALFTSQQRLIFHDLLSQLPSLPPFVHLDASDGFETFPANPAENLCNAVRVGRLQYGLPPFNPLLKTRIHPRPVLSLHARVALIKDLPAGTTVGYRRTHTCVTPTRIAVIAAGYLDGIPSHLSNRGHMLLRGQRVPIIGRITMDMAMLDITELPEAHIGDIATLIGTQASETITLNDIANLTQQPGWELLSNISSRVPRIVLAGAFGA